MANSIKCTCGHSWSKASSSKKDMYVCHICGKDNTMKDGGWLNKYDDGGPMQENYNDASTSTDFGFVGLGYDINGRNYSPAWGGQFAMGGSLPGSVGFTYARTQDPAPSNGPYAKKTLASAQDGKDVSKNNEKDQVKPITQYQRNIGQAAAWKIMEAVRNNTPYELSEAAVNSGIDPSLTCIGGACNAYKDLGIDFSGVGNEKQGVRESRTKGKVVEYNPTFDKNYEAAGFEKLKGRPIEFNELTDIIQKGNLNPGDFIQYYNEKGIPDHTNIVLGSNPNGTLKVYNSYKHGKVKKGESQEPYIYTLNPEAQGFKGKKINVFRVGDQKAKEVNEATRNNSSSIVNTWFNYTLENEIQRKMKQLEQDNQEFAKRYGETAPKLTSSQLRKAAIDAQRRLYESNPVFKRNLEILNTVDFSESVEEAMNKTLNKKQNGGEMKFYQEGLDFKPKSISKNGSVIKDDNKKDIPQAQLGIGFMPDLLSSAASIAASIPTMDEVKKKAINVIKDSPKLRSAINKGISYVANTDWGKEKIKNFANNIDPHGYGNGYTRNFRGQSPFDRIYSAAVLNKKEDSRKEMDSLLAAGKADPGDSLRVDLINQYAGLPQKYNTLKPSVYKPTMGNKNEKYYSSPIVERQILSDIDLVAGNVNVKPEFKTKQDLQNFVQKYFGGEKGKGNNYVTPIEGLGTATTGVGEDEKGYYLSYYDNWDLNPYHGNFADSDNSFEATNDKLGRAILGNEKENIATKKIGTPTQVYGRIYFDKKTGKPKMKKGGVIKDDRGQWAHPGEVTEIGSNDITMQGVDYPVLGISDTGDTKMMKPGKDYKFKGKKVTEFPMKQNGGWLNKYK